VIETAMARIRELGYLDDAEYARRRAVLMAERGYGDFAIRVFLEGLDLPERMVLEALAALPPGLGERTRLIRTIEKRKDLPREKLIRFLSGRGYPIDLILDITGGVET